MLHNLYTVLTGSIKWLSKKNKRWLLYKLNFALDRKTGNIEKPVFLYKAMNCHIFCLSLEGTVKSYTGNKYPLLKINLLIIYRISRLKLQFCQQNSQILYEYSDIEKYFEFDRSIGWWEGCPKFKLLICGKLVWFW